MLDAITIRSAIAAVFLTLLWFLEAARPEFAGRKKRGAHYAGNLGLGLLNGAVTAVLFSGALLVSSEFARDKGFGLLHWMDLPILASWVSAILLFDAWQYVWHILNHKVPVLWRFHAVHHSDAELDASSALRFHTGEIALSSIARLAVLPLLGITIVQLAVYEAILLPIIMFHHSNVRVPERMDRVLRTLIVTPWMHWVHHSDYRPETDSNYSSIFSFWDRLFRTFRLRRHPEEIRLGLTDFDDDEWKPFRSVLAIPFTHQFSKRNED